MKTKIKKYKEISPVEFLVLRDNLGLKKYKKTAKRAPGKKEMLLDLGLKQIEEREKNDFILVGFRKRKITV